MSRLAYTPPISVALVHDFLTQTGGAERLVLQLALAYPDAPIYTSVYEPDGTFAEFRDLDVRASSGWLIRPRAFRLYAPIFPLVFSSLDLSRFDTVVVSSSAFAHHVHHPRAFVYCHTPPRFLYRPLSYGEGGLRRMAAGPPGALVRHLDRRAAARAVSYAANSKVTQRRILDTYSRTARLIYPPVATAHLPADPQPMPARPQALVVSRLLPYKHVEVAVRAAIHAEIPIRVVGEGPERESLERLSSSGVEFLGRVDDSQMASLFTEASVVLAPGVEDFGFAPVEAHWSGRPVISIGAGGALETVVHGQDGLLLPDLQVATWAEALRRIHEMTWSPPELRSAAEPFRFDAFLRRLQTWVTEADRSAPSAEVQGGW